MLGVAVPRTYAAGRSNRVTVIVSGGRLVPKVGTIYIDNKWELDYDMHVISRKDLVEFAHRHPHAESLLNAWYHEARAANWGSSAELKQRYRTASIINAERVVFNICGNKYRLVVRINYASGAVFVRFLETHGECDAIDAEVV